MAGTTGDETQNPSGGGLGLLLWDAFRRDAYSAVRWFWVLAVVLLVVTSWWNSATVAVRILLLWLTAMGVLGPWGRRNLGGRHRAVLAALLGVSFVHLVIFPASGQPLLVSCAKVAVLLLAVASLAGQTVAATRSARVSATWNRLAACGIAATVVMVLAYILTNPRAASVPIPTALAIFAPLAYVLVWGEIFRDYHEPARRPTVVRLLLVTPVVIVALATTQMLLMGIAAQRSGRAFRGGENQSALEWNTAALAINDRLRIAAAGDHLLLQRAGILDSLDRPVDALSTMLRRGRNRYCAPEDKLLRSLCDAYLTTSPLENQIAGLSHPAYLGYFEQLPLPQSPFTRSFLLGLFARSGLLDRLQIEYAQRGLPEEFDFGYLRRCLALKVSSPNTDENTWADYFTAICDFRLGQRDQARQILQRIFAEWPNNHNAGVWLERLAVPDEAGRGAQATTPTAGRIANAQMVGNHRWGLNVDDALWTALEVRPGRYAFDFDVSGLAAEGEWPILDVYLDGALVLEQPVRTRSWTVVRWETQFDRDGCHRFAVVFPNDINKVVEGRPINRNLYLREIRIAKIRRDNSGGEK